MKTARTKKTFHLTHTSTRGLRIHRYFRYAFLISANHLFPRFLYDGRKPAPIQAQSVNRYLKSHCTHTDTPHNTHTRCVEGHLKKSDKSLSAVCVRVSYPKGVVKWKISGKKKQFCRRLVRILKTHVKGRWRGRMKNKDITQNSQVVISCECVCVCRPKRRKF